jgi:hypothetical protein
LQAADCRRGKARSALSAASDPSSLRSGAEQTAQALSTSRPIATCGSAPSLLFHWFVLFFLHLCGVKIGLDFAPHNQLGLRLPR